jgi:hypothetical protein
MANVYAKDNLVRISTVFTLAGVSTDPSTVRAMYKDPNNVVTTLTYGTDAALVKDSIGTYHVDIPVTTAGNWWYRFEGTGACVAANEGEFVVSLSQIV